jgi:hypothetical protein
MEHTVRECEELVHRVSTFVMLSLERGRRVVPALRRVYLVDNLFMELASKCTFEDYVRWTNTDQINSIADDLEAVGLSEAAWITRLALQAAFPQGLPRNDAERDATIAQWTPAQRHTLGALAEYLADPIGEMVRALAAYVLRLGEDVPAGHVGLH